MTDNELFSPSEMQNPFEAINDNLDAAITANFHENSNEATQFRIWARNVLKEYIIKGYVMDDERLKGKNPFGADYFEELLDRIREIRLSERRYYQKITDIYAECSSDYDPKSDITRTFYKHVQNMMHDNLNLLTTAFIDTAEDRARRHLIMKMADWKSLLESYLKFQERDILPDAGSISHEEAEAKALAEYEKFWRIQDKTIRSDFDKLIEGLE